MEFHREKELLNLIKRTVDKRPSNKNLTVLDADGTLWPEDTNHILLERQLKQNQIKFQELLGLEYQTHRYKLCKAFGSKTVWLDSGAIEVGRQKSFQTKAFTCFPFSKILVGTLKKAKI